MTTKRQPSNDPPKKAPTSDGPGLGEVLVLVGGVYVAVKIAKAIFGSKESTRASQPVEPARPATVVDNDDDNDDDIDDDDDDGGEDEQQEAWEREQQEAQDVWEAEQQTCEAEQEQDDDREDEDEDEHEEGDNDEEDDGCDAGNSERVVDHLLDEYRGTFDGLVFSSPDWQVVRAAEHDARERLKELNFPSRDARQDAWERLKALVNEARAREERARDARRWQSERHRDDILADASAGTPSFSGFTILDRSDRESLIACQERLSEARRRLREHSDEMLGEHRRECKEAIREAKEKIEIYWEASREWNRR